MWHKPKKITISVFSVIAHIFTLFFLVVGMLVILFAFLPDGAKNIERYVVFDRARDIEKLFLMARLEENEIKYENLLKKMDGMDYLDKQYYIKKASYIFLIKFYMNTGEITKADSISEEFTKLYQFDMVAKYYRMLVLEKKDMDMAKEYFDKVNSRFGDIKEINSRYKGFINRYLIHKNKVEQ